MKAQAVNSNAVCGGVERRSQPFFLGLIAGQMSCNGIWLVIDYCTGKIGNAIFYL